MLRKLSFAVLVLTCLLCGCASVGGRKYFNVLSRVQLVQTEMWRVTKITSSILELEKLGCGRKVSGVLTSVDLDYILLITGSGFDPKELKGKVLIIPSGDPIPYLINKGRRDIADKIDITIIQSFSEMREPHLSHFGDDFLSDRFFSVYDLGAWGIREEWVNEISKGVLQKSGGSVIIRKANSEDKFHLKIKGPATYLVLVRGKEEKRVILTPSSSPIIFDK